MSVRKADPSTLSSYLTESFHTVGLTNTSLRLRVNWAVKTISGSVKYAFSAYNAREVVLDTSHLKIHAACFEKAPVKFSLGATQPPLGSPLTIEVTPTDGACELEIDFETTASCTALQWLDPAQTAGKKAPYMFSQCEAIHARSLFPCFDTPSVKSTFDIEVESEHPIVVGAQPSGKDECSKMTVYKFNQPVPIPSYLFAIAGGDLACASIGPRSQVWCEPSQLAECQWEFESDMEKFIKTAEEIVFPYEWGTYDLLVLPPSFPFGGMENPNMTFVTPTLIAGDRTLVNVVAHELAHSWSGNLVTNSSWEHFWLNEGWTVYLERRILGALNNEAYRHFEMIIGWSDLEESINQMGEAAANFSRLRVDLQGGVDPDDAFSTVPYEKGSTFLFYLENLLGRQRFDEFIPHYFTKFRGKSLNTDDFIATLKEFFTDKKRELGSIDWDLWLNTPGLPPKPDFDTSLATPCYELAEEWANSSVTNDFSWASKEKDLEGWTSKQFQVFLEAFESKLQKSSGKYSTEAVRALNDTYELASRKNTEILARWYRLALKFSLKEAEEPLAKWLTKVGRMKYVRPGYRQLAECNRQLAVTTFLANKLFYHPICQAMVSRDLGL